ncbi:PaaI family thioesterase [Variovorax sp. PCZ-1]|uniref:PaaI family thioesterase n=1 Tax=Variovorax sp. PCZ-1 TaxID=2835533 RepID=UPI001BCFA90D|nr:PaaI family thioesterase [Variovorax sp. PCZ-1]MBS7808979.1 PaaI family thioesterase [Variovorax sp. PCZ-1]
MTTPEDTLRQWREEEAAMRLQMSKGVGAGVAKPEQVIGLSGLEVLQASLRGEFPYPSISVTMDFALISVSAGEAIFQGTPDSRHLNPMGTVHGGWYATLLDSAVGCAVHTMMPPGRGYTTAELSVNLVRGAVAGKEPLRVIGKVLHCGKQLATAEGRIVDATGKLYAHATTTCLVFEMK